MKIKLKQIKSAIGITKVQKANLQSLNLGKIGRISEFEDTASFLGRLKIVKHLVEIEYVRA